MSSYSLDDLIDTWKQGSLSQEQMTVHMVHHLKLLHDQQINMVQVPPRGPCQRPDCRH